MLVVIDFADYSDSALKSLEEQWTHDHGQLGTETMIEFQNKNREYSWSHSDSAVQRFCPVTDRKHGSHEMCVRIFRSQLRHNLSESSARVFLIYNHRWLIYKFFRFIILRLV